MAHHAGMNRFALLAVAVIAVVIAWLAFFAGPTVEPPPPVAPPTVTGQPPPPETPPPEAPPAPTPAVPPVADAGPTGDAEAPSGPVTIDLGEHDILLAERDGRFLRLHLSLVTPDARAARAVRLKRRELVRMLYFLVTKRTAEGVESAGGRQRLIDDLLPRFRNQARAGGIERIEVDRFEIVHKAMQPIPDAGP